MYTGNEIIFVKSPPVDGGHYWQPQSYHILLTPKDRLAFKFNADNSQEFNLFYKTLSDSGNLGIYFVENNENAIYLVTENSFILLPNIPDKAIEFIKEQKVFFICEDDLNDILFIID